MSKQMKIFKQGAEAKLYTCEYLGKPTLIKERFVKKYRNPSLDTHITKERIKNEARSIVRSKKADVRTPALYLIDFERRRIYMEYFQNSITVKDFIITFTKLNKKKLIKCLNFYATFIGETVRKLHDNSIIHGDLTTSNMLLVEKNPTTSDETKWLDHNNVEIVLIDFGLSYINSSAEDKGVDLYVLDRAIISTHNDYPDLFSKIFEAYKSFSKLNTKGIVSKYEDVRARGRKRTMVG